ncbi:MAG: FIVAR domain-containing protein [Oscillospiraceae bacterium]|jgi:hypothetical protein|nr:FIVAR domain-containing protein [Oscillospiraceae bacterium]
MKRFFGKKSNKALALILCAAVLLGSVAAGLSLTLAARPDINVTLAAPGPYTEIEVGVTSNQSASGAYRWNSSDPAIATATTQADKTADIRGVKAGLAVVTVGSRGGMIISRRYQITDSRNINAYVLKDGGEVFLKAQGATAAIGLTTTPSSAASSINWTSLNEDIVTAYSGGTVKAENTKGAAIVLGEFTDKWGVQQMIHVLVTVGVSASDSNLNELIDLVREGEAILALDPNPYTTDSLSDLQDAVDAGKTVLNSTDPADQDISDAIDALKDAIDDLDEKQDTGTGSNVVTDGNGNYYKPVGDPEHVYELVNPDGTPKYPSQYYYDEDDDLTNGNDGEAYPNCGFFYVEDPAGSNIFKQVQSNGDLKESPAVWGGEDKSFGTPDDKSALKFGNDYYVGLGQNVFQKVGADGLLTGDMMGGGTDGNPATNPLMPIVKVDGVFYAGPYDGYYIGDKTGNGLSTNGDSSQNPPHAAIDSTDQKYWMNNGSMQTEEPNQVPNTLGPTTQIGTVVEIDGYQWAVIKNMDNYNNSGKNYVYLLKWTDIGSLLSFGTTNNYEGSTVQQEITTWYKNTNLPTIKAHAVVPVLGDHSFQAAATTAPSSVLASAGGTTKDVLFAPSLEDMKPWTQIALSLGVNTRWWIRTAAISPNFGYYCLTTSTMTSLTSSNVVNTMNDAVMIRPAVILTY